MNLRSMLLLLLPVLVLVGGASGQSKQKTAVKGGPKIGAKVENFSLTDQAGKKRDLKSFLKNGPVAIVFYRSADW